jgi:mono/diheme cytochrome c family protein
MWRRFLLALSLVGAGCRQEPLVEFPDQDGYTAARSLPGYSAVKRLPAFGPPNLAVGEKLFIRNCAGCHGPEGRGDGSMRFSSMTPPRNLTHRGEYRYGHGYQGVFRTVKYGVGKDMPAWQGRLSEQELVEVANYVLHVLQRRPKRDNDQASAPSACSTVANGNNAHLTRTG